MSIKYIITNNSEDISIALAKLCMANQEYPIFDTLVHPTTGDTAMIINNLDKEILVHPNCDTHELINLVDCYTDKEEVELSDYIKSFAIPQLPPTPASGYILGRFLFRSLVDGYVDLREEQYMVDNGWFTQIT